MDLLVFLIKKNELDIYDIPIAVITDQYLQYLDLMKAMNIDFAGDFIVMAATLMHIKSKTLLPVYDSEDEDAEDPRDEITRPLIEYLKMKSVAEQLEERLLLGEDFFLRRPAVDEIPEDAGDEIVKIGITELIAAFRNILENLPGGHSVDMSDERISIKDRINEIIQILEEKGSVTFNELFESQFTRIQIVVSFLAILEMAKLSLIRMNQNTQTGLIRLFYV